MANLAGIMQLYTAYFNRAADKAGVDYWAGMMDSNGWTLDDVAQSFSDQTEYQNQYNGLIQSQIVAKVYQNVLNRDGEADGIDYWSGELSSGNISVSQLVQAIVNAAVEKDDSGNYKNGTDASIFNNKIEVSQYCYDNNINATGTDAISLSSISIDNSSIDSIKSIASAFIDDSSSNDESHTPSYTIKMWSTTDGMDYYQLNEDTILEYIHEDDVYHLFDVIKNGNTLTLDSLTHDDTFTMTINDYTVGSPVTFKINEDGMQETVISTLDFVGYGSYHSYYTNEVLDAEYVSIFESGDSGFGVHEMFLKPIDNTLYLYNEAANDTVPEIIGMYQVQNNNLYIVFEKADELELNIGNISTGESEVYYLTIA